MKTPHYFDRSVDLAVPEAGVAVKCIVEVAAGIACNIGLSQIEHWARKVVQGVQ